MVMMLSQIGEEDSDDSINHVGKRKARSSPHSLKQNIV